MKLNDYLDKHGAKTKLATEIGAQVQLVWQWASGVRAVPIDRCYAIEQATNGIVTRRDLRPDDWQKYGQNWQQPNRIKRKQLHMM